MTLELNILIIDDEQEVAELFSRMLESLPRVASVQVCKSIEESIEILSNKSIVNVVVLDLFLNITEGLTTLKEFKLLYPELPVVIVTGYDISGLSFQCFEEGASDFLVKPDISPQLLYKACLYSVEKDLIAKKGKQAEDTLKSLLNIAPIGIGMAVDRHIQWVNNHMCELVQRSRSELEANFDVRALYETQEEYDRVGIEKYPAVYRGERGVVETQWVTPEGALKDILLGTSAIGPGSPSAGVIFTALDITKIKNVRRKIQEERDKAQRFLDIAGSLILVLKVDGTISLINQRGCEILGYDSSEELIGKNWFDTCILPEDREAVKAIFQDILVGGVIPENAVHHENYVVRKDGTTRYIVWTNSYIKDPCGVVALSSGEDITERKKVEEALRASESRYRRLFESAQDGVLLINFETGQIIDVNPYLVNMLGYTREEYLGKKLWELGKFKDVVENKQLFGELQDKGYVRYEHLPLETKEGMLISVEFVSNVYFVNGNTIIQCNIRDITDRVMLEKRQSLIIRILQLLNTPYAGTETIQDLLSVIQEFTGIEAIALRLQDGQDYPYFVYKGFSHDFIRMENLLCPVDEYGCPHLQPDGRPVLDCMCGCVIRGHTNADLPCFTVEGSFWTNSTTELLKDKADNIVDHRTRNRCNTEGYESVAIIPLKVGDEIIGSLQLNDSRSNQFSASYINFLEELAVSIAVAVKRSWQEDRIKTLEIAKTKDLLQSSRLLNSGIAHELRTPMQALLNCLELIKEEVAAYCAKCDKSEKCETKDAIIELADDGLDRTEYSVKVLNSLSEYSKIATGEEVHLINVVPELKTIMRTLMFTDQFKSMGGGAFDLQTSDEGGECFVSINRIDFSQLITNLCRNAREAIAHDDPKVIISVERDAPNVTIKVTDNGRGIDSNLGDKVFEPYFSTKENPDGYNQGLGLAMVRDIIAAYGGTITYTSEPGHTEFIVKLPCEQKE